ncbi:uncharacterized protein F5Z01DRAFT_242842 [Emericellopsis atlantica]|uniref:FAD-binding FR-type domain-containing protein n=1 Tax=Emericellopsis atlantica TaxID=2614577 RepID=A0A9P8CP24_9HYPO|nr:uncharacterized protein F5Z01DRAFT_242842 [Emericellopsis atlantica]KAG9252331.1 hypothetical protein F5Z01DRAFT_242842 [Emericellopsis atlantica]
MNTRTLLPKVNVNMAAMFCARSWTGRLCRPRASRFPTKHATFYRPSSTSSHPPTQPRSSHTRRRILFLLLGTTTFLLFATPAKPPTLNETTFVPYTITSRASLSPASFILTLVPQTPNPEPMYLLPGTNRWRHPLWSVEFKQPEVQISRHYTPLPPQSKDGDDMLDGAESERNGALRFYIRAHSDGEMSHYLRRLRPHDTVQLRGPHIGFDLVKRLGACKNIVFLAGGTGLVPGMQAARVALDGYEDTNVSLLWAVRSRKDIQSTPPSEVSNGWWGSSGPTEIQAAEGLSPIARQLADMKAQYGKRLSVQVVVDEEGSSFQPVHLQKALLDIGKDDKLVSNPGSGCALHDQKLSEQASEFEGDAGPNCACSPVEGTLPGKNLFIISGPGGFVKHYAGDKVWQGGRQTQGPVGGVAAQLQKKNPQLAKEWLVLKL